MVYVFVFSPELSDVKDSRKSVKVNCMLLSKRQHRNSVNNNIAGLL
jgi:hypothetical protein